MRQTIERTGAVPDHPDAWLPTFEPSLLVVWAVAVAAIRADRSWKFAKPVTLTVSPDPTTWRIHCVLDTEAGLIPILPGDPVPSDRTGTVSP